MSNVDWSKAPEGATHWMPGSQYWQEGFWKREGEANYFFEGGEWASSVAKPFGHPALVKRPAAPQWSGEGLPPVGAVCMVYPHNTLWGFGSTSGHRREILAYHGDFVWLGSDCMALESTRIDKVDFKPLRTPEQIAKAERDAAIHDIAVAMAWHPTRSAKSLAAMVYDAGYRKLEQPE